MLYRLLYSVGYFTPATLQVRLLYFIPAPLQRPLLYSDHFTLHRLLVSATLLYTTGYFTVSATHLVEGGAQPRLDLFDPGLP
jgi:hypothetical protein